MDLRAKYLSYISRINSGQSASGGLSEFVNEGVVHNDSAPMSVDEYAKIITDSQRDLPGLFFEVDMLVVEDDASHQATEGDGSVAAIIKLTYNPTPTTWETFREHVFYRLEHGKISRVWSVLDGAGLKWKEKRDALEQ
ncbi:hypothetical protein EDD37DRAFT_654217 [Exophiala viscosa]|uniref:SnoaL-like domain-containing protein n=1 Tax=Exophiala viscosa TaxID=2486360 RepID=A0AAN6DLT5_9EURO|nr:hypothetical protein EDD36DRAFT_469629 [Exophiala viscosa]KAI1620109.1 hypothetical protein EDD37DRAFT_654217 [Exophiala viscosa]